MIRHKSESEVGSAKTAVPLPGPQLNLASWNAASISPTFPSIARSKPFAKIFQTLGRTELSSRLLKNCLEQAISLLVCNIFECEAVFVSLFSRRQAPHLGVSAPGRDTTARTYCAGTAAAIRFRMRTRL